MKPALGVLMVTGLFLVGCGKKEEKKPQVNISVPGVNIKVGEGGASIETPGGSVKTDQKGTEINTPGGNVKVNQ
jgi:hypothetical protein